MTIQDLAHPPSATRDEWLAARKTLLVHEKELTKHYDRVSAERRRLPMVKLEKTYMFDGPEGKRSLLDLFDGHHQLIVYHFMFDPAWENGCDGCTGYVNELADLSMLPARDTQFVLISRAPLDAVRTVRCSATYAAGALGMWYWTRVPIMQLAPALRVHWQDSFFRADVVPTRNR